MNTFLVLGAVLATPAGVAGPVVVKQLTPEEPPQFKRVYLADVEHTEASFRNETGALATDTLVTIDFTGSREIVEVSHLGVVDVSQAGPIVSIVASQSLGPDVVINRPTEEASSSSAGSGRQPRDWPFQLMEQTTRYTLGSMTVALVYHLSESMRNEPPPSQPHHYEIRIVGLLDSRWDRLKGFSVSHIEPGETILRGRVADDAALRGLLARIGDLNLNWISLRLVDPEEPINGVWDG